MKLQNLTLYLFAFSAFISCITLEDEFSPTVSLDEETQNVYFYKDSLHVNVTFRDNVLIDEGRVKIQIVDNQSTLNDTIVFGFDTTYTNVDARLINFDSTFLIPAFVRTGQYFLEVSNTDAGENQVTDTTYFYISTDTTGPVIDNLNVVSAIAANQENDALCRGEIIVVNGAVTDNVALKRIGVSIGNQTPRYFNVEGTSLTLESIVQQQLFIPDSLANGEYDLNIFVEDRYRNITQETVRINVNCDDLPAQFVSYEEASGIEIPSNRIVQLHPGEVFQLSSLKFSDNGGLDSARLEVTRIGVPTEMGGQAPRTEEVPITIPLNGVSEADVASLLSEHLSFEFDLLDTQAGETIFINIKVKDAEQTWDNASFFRFSLVAREDLAPDIRVADLVINGVKEYIPENEVQDFTNRFSGQSRIEIRVEGKVQENVGLASIMYTFESDNDAIPTFGGGLDQAEAFTSYPVDLGTTLDTSFPIEASVADVSGDVLYTLTIVATDIRGQTDKVVYKFNVTY